MTTTVRVEAPETRIAPTLPTAEPCMLVIFGATVDLNRHGLTAANPPADVAITGISDLLDYDLAALLDRSAESP